MTPTGDPLDLGPPGPVLGLRAFRCGEWNDVPTDEGDVRALAANFARFAKPLDTGDPFLVPCVSLFHDNKLSFGRVTRAAAAGEFLDLDLDGVPLTIRRWMKGDTLASPSIEFWDPYRFIGPAGVKWPTRVLKLVTLLGHEPPGARGLPPLSAATYPGLDDAAAPTAVAVPRVTGAALAKYRDAAGVSKFADQAPATRSGRRPVNPERQKLLDALKAAGIDVQTVTDDVPDALLQSVLACLQAAARPQNPNADAAKPAPPAAPAQPAKPVGMTDTVPNPDDGVQMFRDAAGQMTAVRVPKAVLPIAQALAAQLDVLSATNTANAAAQARAEMDRRKGRVRVFRDEMTRPDATTKAARMTPAQFDALEPLLLACDDAGVRKFADGNGEGTELEERFAALRSAYPAGVRRFGDGMPNPAPGANATALRPTALPGRPPKADEISPEVKAMLASIPEGVAALERLR